ncbi:MAG: hypothetical protein EBR82_24265 [Caulobacteraceae bacterium]|nr:hypothetical protein [Caulobacteraceae bacterium]
MSQPQTLLLDAKIKDFFFDRPSVKRLTDDIVLRGLNKAGAQIRKTMIRLQRRVGKKGTPSNPGQPPKFRNVNNESVSLRNVQYAYNPQTQSVVVGPIKLNGSEGAVMRSGTTVANLMEFSGQARITERYIPFDLRSAYQFFGNDAGDSYKRSGGWSSREDVIRTWGQNVVDDSVNGAWVPVTSRNKRAHVTRTRVVQYPRRPFVSVALQKMFPRIPQQFGGGVQQ